ncbi:phosphate transport regulator [Candidatus Acidianus copahuensis]|uniref:phosphate transport regulator n=1 Tax=Candidatus Acidianus copahuensis TaxID=1160895 RepID=UPI000A5126C7|nr:phosphate transport regulator [Candidatus Acidianus copahuensis]
MSIARMTLEERTQEITLQVIDEIRALYEYLESDDKSMKVYGKINGLKNEIENNKYLLGQYIIKIKEGLEDRDLYIDVINNLERISQNIDAAAYRISILIAKNIKVNGILYNLIKTICEKIIASLTHMMEALRMLSVEAKKSIDFARYIIKLEEEVDDLYRNFELKLLEEKYQD